MSLTKRRKQFLTSVIQIFNETGEPVHYGDIARALNVSKWTAYDVLKVLEQQGLIKSEYSVMSKNSSPGRSNILFSPTQKAYEALEMFETESPYREEWNSIRNHLLKRFKEKKTPDVHKFIEELVGEIQEIELPLLYNAYVIMLFLTLLIALSQGSINAIRGILLISPKPEMKLLLFVGTAFGAIIKKELNLIPQVKLNAYIDMFQNQLNKVSLKEKILLGEFLDEALMVAG
ncbi:MAG: hypothetical protein HPY70_09025 [Firmicutes bacterium]|nr:hypothetical protein [Bacillota bacterium]